MTQANNDEERKKYVSVVTSDETIGFVDAVFDAIEEYDLPPATTIGLLETVKQGILLNIIEKK